MRKQRTTRKRAGKGVTFDRVRQLALKLPEMEEAISYSTASFRVGGKIVARLNNSGESLALKVEYAVREVLMGTHPEAFYLTDHYRSYPWVLVRLSEVDEGLLKSLIEEAWRRLAPKRALAAFEASRD